VTGKVLDRPVSEGTYVAINDPILQVADVRPENLVMRASVDEEDIDKVKEGQLVTMVLYSFPNEKEPLAGKVIQIYPKADPERRTFEVDVALDAKDKRIRPGMTGELAFQTAYKEKALVVPSQAVQDGKLYLVLDGRIKRIDAKVGIKGIEKVEVLEGVQPGDRVVISPAGDLKDGQSVRTDYVDPLTAGRANRPAESAPGKFGF
jgi:RND family efflux transporter MFP subunit